jgi:hypothetical protein
MALRFGSSRKTAPGGVSQAAVHKTIDEIWYVLSGEGEHVGGSSTSVKHYLSPDYRVRTSAQAGQKRVPNRVPE